MTYKFNSTSLLSSNEMTIITTGFQAQYVLRQNVLFRLQISILDSVKTTGSHAGVTDTLVFLSKQKELALVCFRAYVTDWNVVLMCTEV